MACETNADLFIGMLFDMRRTGGWPANDAAPLPAALWNKSGGSD